MSASTLPANVEAERSVLGAILLDNQAYLDASDRLNAEDFSLDSHRRIYGRMVHLLESNRPVDMITLIEELDTHKDLQPIGDVGYVSSLLDGVPDRPSIAHYVDIVIDKAMQRSLIHLCNATLARIGEQTDNALPIMADMEEAVARIAGKPRQQAKALREVLGRVLNNMAKERVRTTDYIGIPTGVHDLDQVLGGIRESEVWIAGGDPGRGKTSLGIGFAMTAVTAGVPTVDFTLEMLDEQVGRRIVAGFTPAEAFGARDARLLSEAKWHQVIEDCAQLGTLPLWIDDSSALSLRELRSRVKLYKKKFGVRLVVVDYLRLLTASGKDVRERVSNIAFGLAQLAKDEELSILALSQLSRGGDLNRVPDMTDLKESGDLEASAHVVLLLHRPYDQDKGGFTGDDSIIIGKAREGPMSRIDTWYDDRTLLFKPRFTRGLEAR
jgi:replicative DNA helicase